MDEFLLRRRERAFVADRAPELRKTLARPFAAALEIAFGADDGVHRAGAGPGDRLDVEAAILEDRVKDAPGEGAVRPPALQGQADLLLAGPIDRRAGFVHLYLCCYSAVQPPSIEILAPVICEAASVVRKTASAAT